MLARKKKFRLLSYICYELFIKLNHTLYLKTPMGLLATSRLNDGSKLLTY